MVDTLYNTSNFPSLFLPERHNGTSRMWIVQKYQGITINIVVPLLIGAPNDIDVDTETNNIFRQSHVNGVGIAQTSESSSSYWWK